MRYRQFGRTGLRVSRLCLGTWELSGDWGDDREPGVQAVRRAFDLGINFFDTAYAYGEGAAEAALARGLGDLVKTHRDELVICTKGGVEIDSSRGTGFGDKTLVRNSDAEFLRKGLEQSLRTLGVDYVDIFLIHWPDPTVPFEETAGAVQAFIDAGLARWGGVSNFSLEQLRAFDARGALAVTQIPFNLIDRAVEDEIIPYCEQNEVAVMGYAALARGALAGTLQRDQVFAADDWRSIHPAFQGERLNALVAAVEHFGAVAQERYGASLAQLALAWVMNHPLGIVPVVGAQIPAHIEDSAKAADLELSEEQWNEIANIELAVPSFGSGGNIGVRAPAER